MEIKFEKLSFEKRLKSMLKVDFKRAFTTPLLYIMIGICLVIPILILVMTTMMAGTTTTNPSTGDVTTIEAFENVWQIIGTVSGDSASEDAASTMSITSMCNINMLYFAVAVFACLFVAEDFRSGYAKNLFTVRAKKSDYVISKTVLCFVAGAIMLIAFFVGAMLGGGIASLPFDLGAASVGNVIACLIAKILMVAVFAPISLIIAVAAKQRAWLSILGSLGASMLLFTMVPMITPLDSGIMNVILCLAGGAMFSFGLGAASNLILNKTNIF